MRGGESHMRGEQVNDLMERVSKTCGEGSHMRGGKPQSTQIQASATGDRQCRGGGLPCVDAFHQIVNYALGEFSLPSARLNVGGRPPPRALTIPLPH